MATRELFKHGGSTSSGKGQDSGVGKAEQQKRQDCRSDVVELFHPKEVAHAFARAVIDD